MGYPMARNLLRAGHEVALWSNTAAKARELAEAGVRSIALPAEPDDVPKTRGPGRWLRKWGNHHR